MLEYALILQMYSVFKSPLLLALYILIRNASFWLIILNISLFIASIFIDASWLSFFLKSAVWFFFLMVLGIKLCKIAKIDNNKTLFKNRAIPFALFFSAFFLNILLITLIKEFVSSERITVTAPIQIKDQSNKLSVDGIIKLTNIQRNTYSLPDLVTNEKLNVAAKAKANHMIQNNYWAHSAPDGTEFWEFISDSGYIYEYAGENLAKGFLDNQDVVNEWMSSPSHKENILGENFTEIGIGIALGRLSGEDNIVIVQMFGAPRVDN